MTPRRYGVLAVVAMVGLVGLLLPPGAAATPSSGSSAPTGGSAGSAQPIFAVFDQGLTPADWNGPASDKPAAGPYSSDDRAVMTSQVEQAQAAGIDGFLVRWTNTPAGVRQLTALADVAHRRNFRLAMMYDAVQSDGRPLPAGSVATGLQEFRSRFADQPVFYRIGGKPLVIVAGTPRYSHDSLAAITGPVRDRLTVLGTELSAAGVQRIADVTDGDAYLDLGAGSSATPSGVALLSALGAAPHAADKYWIASFGPGFSAGPARAAVPRKGGATLLGQFNAAVRSAPDLLALTSWNDYPSGSQVEPSRLNGRTALDALADLTGTHAPVPASAVDSSGSLPGAHGRSGWDVTVLLIVVPGVLFLGVTALGVALRRRARRRRRQAVAAQSTGRHAAPSDSLVTSGGR